MKANATLMIVGIFCLPALVAIPAARAEDDLLPAVSKFILDKDKEVRAVGLEQVRDGLKGIAATRQIVALLPQLPPDGQAALIIALGDRGDAAALPEVRQFIQSEVPAIRAAAIRALGALGDKNEAAVLVPLLGTPATEQDAAAAILCLHGPGVHEALLAEAAKTPAVRVKVFPLLVTRYALGAVPGLLAAAQDSDEHTRSAALDALGQLGGPELVADLARLVLSAPREADAKKAERALAVLSERTGKVDTCAQPLLAFMETQGPAERAKLFSALGRIGGRAALKAVLAAYAGNDPALHAAGFQALCNWPDGTVSARLVEIATKGDDKARRAAALEALIRVAPLPNNKSRPESNRSDKERLAMLKKAMELSLTKQQKTAILRRAGAIYTFDTLHFVLPYLDQPEFDQVTAETIVAIAHHKDVRHSHQAEFDAVLDRVIQISKNPRVIDEAKRYREDRT
jgi:HEAT repeat protein